jgi:hypothetical protein
MDMSMDDDEESSDMEMDMDTDNDDVEMDMDMDMDMTDDMSGMDDMDDMDDETVDLTNASDEEILKVFKAMGEDDGIIVKKDNSSINLKDENEDVEYDIHLGESEDMDTSYEEEDEMWGPYESMYKEESDSEEMMSEEDDSEMMDEEEEEIVYEIEMSDDDEESEEETENYSEGMMDEDDEMMSQEDESYDYKKSMKAETKESKMAIKPKGVGMGKSKFSYKSQKGGFKEDMKHGNPKMGTGKPKFEYKEGKKSETKEAARTLGNGSKNSPMRKGLPKLKVRADYRNESVNNELNILREKNDEYRKALNIFRQKLNEVAVFNSNLAYATRLFTEHSTSKQEKINILRRFDGVESIKESKNLYKTLKEELSGKEGKVVTESIENKIDRAPQSGSAVNLIESKTYENPQFMRMKDLMSKLK